MYIRTNCKDYQFYPTMNMLVLLFKVIRCQLLSMIKERTARLFSS